MLEVIKLTKWDEFENFAKNEIYSEIYFDNIRLNLFRGQSNAAWGLETTLERSIGKNLLAENYFKHINEMHNKIETFTNLRWELPSYSDFKKKITDKHQIDEQTFFLHDVLETLWVPDSFARLDLVAFYSRILCL